MNFSTRKVGSIRFFKLFSLRISFCHASRTTPFEMFSEGFVLGIPAALIAGYIAYCYCEFLTRTY